MKTLATALLCMLVATPIDATRAGAWGRTFAIEVTGDTLAEPLIITDPAIVEELSFWVGPGTGHTEFMGAVKHDASITDWARGQATTRPEGLARYQVRFLLEPRDDPPAYIVFYEPDPNNNSGYIFYPKRTNSIVTHGVNGTWRYASILWNNRVGAAIATHAES